jgi:DNA-binding NtrC family response regulator
VEDAIVGQSAPLIAAKVLARQVAPIQIPVLIMGETGTGKELLANYIHEHSGCRGHLIEVDCGALPEDLTESLLFGHQKGAFTGAVSDTPGLLLQARGGSLLLDELANLPRTGQAKLLRVLETGEVRRVGASTSRAVSFRLIATAQPSLADHVRAGAFRQDLLQRVAGMVIELPSLGQRLDDVPLLASHFAARRTFGITDDAIDFLMEQEWPGNVRQLRWTVTRGGLFESDGWIDRNAIKRAIATGPRLVVPETGQARRTSAVALASVCRHHAGDPDRIAEVLGVSRSTLYRRLKDEGLSLRKFRRAARAVDSSDCIRSSENGMRRMGRDAIVESSQAP